MRIFTRFILFIIALFILLLIVAWGFLIPTYLRDNVSTSITDIEKRLNVKIVYDSIAYTPFTTNVTIEEVAVKPNDSWVVLFSSKKVIVSIDVISALFKDDVTEFVSLKMIEPVLVIGFGNKVSSLSFEKSKSRSLIRFYLSDYENLVNMDENYSPCSNLDKKGFNKWLSALTRVENITEGDYNDKLSLDRIPQITIKNGKILLQRDSKLSVLLGDVNGRLGKKTRIKARVFGESDCEVDGSIMSKMTLSETEVDTDVLKQAIFGDINTIFYKSSSLISGYWKVGGDFKLLINIKGGEVHISKGSRAFTIESAGLVLDNKRLTVSNASLSYKGMTFSVSGIVGLLDRTVDMTAYSPKIDLNLLTTLLFGKGLPNVKLPNLGSISIKIEGTIDKPVYRISYEKGE